MSGQVCTDPYVSSPPTTVDMSRPMNEAKQDAYMSSCANHLDVYPDGGARAWLVVFGSACSLFSTVGLITTWGVFQEHYETSLLSHMSTSDIAWIGSIQYFAVYMPSLISGRLLDIGSFRAPFALASIIIVASEFLLGQCKAYWQVLLCQGVVSGLACGFLYGPTLIVTGHWFKERLGLALGVASLGSSVGGTVFPIIFQKLEPMVGMAWTMRVIGFINLLSLGLANLTIARRLPPTKDNRRLLSFRTLKSTPFAIYVFSGLIGFLGAWTIATYIDVSATAAGISPNFSSYLVSIINASTGVGRAVGGLLIDRFGAVNVLALFNLIVAALTYSWPFARTKGDFAAIAVLYGFFSGSYTSSFTAPLYNMGDVGDLGERIGMAASISSFGDLLGLPIEGALFKTSLGYKALGLFGGSALVATVIGMLIMRHLVLQKVLGIL